MVTASVLRWLSGGALALALALVARPSGPAAAARSDFIGAEACGACHQEILESWRQTAHAGAESVLGEGRSDARCQTCHSTGEAPGGRRAFAGVQCEACHGPGAAYQAEDVMRDPALARALGLRDLSTGAARARVCARCHREGAGTRLAPFDPEAAWKRIAH